MVIQNTETDPGSAADLAEARRDSDESFSSEPTDETSRTCGGGGGAPAMTEEHVVTGRWITTTAYCGDEVRLQVSLTGFTENTAVRIEIYRLAVDLSTTTIHTINVTLPSSVGEERWVCNAPSADWRNDRIKFRVHASGMTAAAEASNEFTFRQRPTTVWSNLNVAHASPSGFVGLAEIHDARLEANRVHLSMKIKATGHAFSDAKKEAAKTLVQDVWNNGFTSKKFHRTGCGRGATCDCTFDCCKADCAPDNQSQRQAGAPLPARQAQ